MSDYYNEFDPYAAQWLRNLIAAGYLPAGDVDERDIRDVRPDDLRGYIQCHFYAGIGGWPLALRMAGWADDQPVWTGSCPCQPFSAAGRGAGFADERHLWPHWFHLVSQCQPPVLFGEQVASKDGLAWFDLVSSDLEGAGYTVGAADMCAAGVGAPHIRQRLWWVGVSDRSGRVERGPSAEASRHGDTALAAGGRCGMADSMLAGRPERGAVPGDGSSAGGVGADLLGDPGSEGLARRSRQSGDDGAERPASERAGGWSDLEWLPCRDGKWRPTQPGLQPLAPRVSGRVAVVRPGLEEEVRYVNAIGALRGAGNAIVPQVAAEFVQAFLECRP